MDAGLEVEVEAQDRRQVEAMIDQGEEQQGDACREGGYRESGEQEAESLRHRVMVDDGRCCGELQVKGNWRMLELC